jgi:SAM-dependent methyltransferase
MSESTPTPVSNSTLAFYDENAEVYAAQTWGLDLAALHDRFLAYVPPGGHILDAGSGSGRDTAAFLHRGYRVTAFDASPRLAALSSEATGQPTHVLRFDEVELCRQFDGVWASASLLHVPAADLPDALSRLARALAPGGTLLATFQEGEGTVTRDGRFYQLVTRDALRTLVAAEPLLDLIDLRRDEDVTRSHVSWLQVLAHRAEL